MSARDEIASRLWWSVPSADNAEAKAVTEQMLDAYRAEVLAEAANKFDTYDWALLTGKQVASLIRDTGPAAGKDTREGESTQAAPDADRIVAYRNVIRRGLLLCREHGNALQGSIPLTSEELPEGGICTDCGRDVLIAPDPFVPRTERERWVDIADALNAAAAAGMPVGINTEGILTDHNAWAVVWNREQERWEVGGYDDEPPAEAPDPDRWLNCSRTRPSCPNAERARYAIERGWTQDGRAGDWLCTEHAPGAQAATDDGNAPTTIHRRTQYGVVTPDDDPQAPYLATYRDRPQAAAVAVDYPGSRIVQRTVTTATSPWAVVAEGGEPRG